MEIIEQKLKAFLNKYNSYLCKYAFLQSILIPKEKTGLPSLVIRFFLLSNFMIKLYDNIPSIFWISFPTNNLIGNVAAGTHGIGIWIDLQDTGGSAHNEFANELLHPIKFLPRK